MEGELWAGAIVLAREFGICPIARTLPMDYTALRKRVERPPEAGLVKPTFA